MLDSGDIAFTSNNDNTHEGNPATIYQERAERYSVWKGKQSEHSAGRNTNGPGGRQDRNGAFAHIAATIIWPDHQIVRRTEVRVGTAENRIISLANVGNGRQTERDCDQNRRPTLSLPERMTKKQ